MKNPYPIPHPPQASKDTAVGRLVRSGNLVPRKSALHYRKGLYHDEFGQADPYWFEAFVDALNEHTPGQLQSIPITERCLPEEDPAYRPLVNPQAAFAGDRQTASGFYFQLPLPPEQCGALNATAAEILEVYWMAVLREKPFKDFKSDQGVKKAIEDLQKLPLYWQRGSANRAGQFEARELDHHSVFRGGDWKWEKPEEHVGPYISQFLYLEIPYGTLKIDQRKRQADDKDQGINGKPAHMLTWDDWLAVQKGRDEKPTVSEVKDSRYILNMLDLAHYVHIDQLYEAYLNACLILLGANAPWNSGNPYGQKNAPCDGIFRKSQGFGTFGGPHVLSAVTEVATRALKAVWYQKWVGNLRLRPEAYGGLYHLASNGQVPKDPSPQSDQRLNEARETARAVLGQGFDVLNASSVWPELKKVYKEHDRGYQGYLLPMVYNEGSPMHPAYGAGHATVAGACTTILKAFFAGEKSLKEVGIRTMVPNDGGTDLVNYSQEELTIGGELDKLAANISIGRNMAGVHWRSDYTQSILLGQRVAISMLYHQRRDYHERPWSFKFRSFGGKQVEITYDPDARREGVFYDGNLILDGAADGNELHDALDEESQREHAAALRAIV